MKPCPDSVRFLKKGNVDLIKNLIPIFELSAWVFLHFALYFDPLLCVFRVLLVLWRGLESGFTRPNLPRGGSGRDRDPKLLYKIEV